MDPFSRNMGPPTHEQSLETSQSLWNMISDIPPFSPIIDTKTGDVLRLSASGNVIDTVKTDPRLVPSHSVGMSVDGSDGERKKA